MNQKIEELGLAAQVKQLLETLLNKMNQLNKESLKFQQVENEVGLLADALRGTSASKIQQVSTLIMDVSNNKKFPIGFGSALSEVIMKHMPNNFMMGNPIPEMKAVVNPKKISDASQAKVNKIGTVSSQPNVMHLSVSKPAQYSELLKKFNSEFTKRDKNDWASFVNRDPNLLQVDKDKLLKKIEESNNLKHSLILTLNDIREDNDPVHLHQQLAFWQRLIKDNVDLSFNDRNELTRLATESPQVKVIPKVSAVSPVIKRPEVNPQVVKDQLEQELNELSRHPNDAARHNKWKASVRVSKELDNPSKDALLKRYAQEFQRKASPPPILSRVVDEQDKDAVKVRSSSAIKSAIQRQPASAVDNRFNAALVNAAQPGRLAPPVVASNDAKLLWTQIYKGDFTYPNNSDLRNIIRRALPLFERVEPFKSDAALQSALSEAINPTIYRNDGNLEDRIDLTLRKYFSRLQVSSAPERYSQFYNDINAGSFAMSGANLAFDVVAREDENNKGFADKYKALVDQSREQDSANPIAMVQGIRGDGNCYYRSVLRSHMEHLIGMREPNQKQAYFKHLSEAIKHNLGKQNSLFDQRATPIEKQNVNKLLAKLDQAARGEIWSGPHALVEFERDMAMSDSSSIDSSLITAARYMTAQYVADYRDVIYNGISLKDAVELSGNGPYEQYVNLIIRDGVCAEGAFVNLGMLPALIGAKSNIHIMPREDKFPYQKLTITEGLCGEYTGPKIQPLQQAAELLFQPGHYDMLRTKSSFEARQAQYNSYAASIQVGPYLAAGMRENPQLNKANIVLVRASANQDPMINDILAIYKDSPAKEKLDAVVGQCHDFKGPAPKGTVLFEWGGIKIPVSEPLAAELIVLANEALPNLSNNRK